MTDDLHKLHAAVSAKFDIGDYESFAAKMETPEQRKSFYDAVSSKGLDLGDYNAYEDRLKKKEDGISPMPSDDSSPATSTSVEDRFPFLQEDRREPPVAEADVTAVSPPATELELDTRGEFTKKYGLPGEKPQPTVKLEEVGKPADTMIQKWAGERIAGDPELQQAMSDMQRTTPVYEQAGRELRDGLTTPGELHPYQKVAEQSEFARTALGMLRGVNEGVANTLRALDGAERAFWDAVPGTSSQGDGWFGHAADYMEQSMENNWPDVEQDKVVGKLVYDIGHMVPFFGEMMITPQIGKIGQLESLLTTKGFATAYGDADVRRELGGDAKPLLEGLYGAGMGMKDAMAFHLLGYGSGKMGEVVSTASRAGDKGVAANMLANGLGFAGYSAVDQYIQTGEVDPNTLQSSFLLGVGLSSPAMMQMLGNRAMNNYYGTSSVNVGKVRQLPFNTIELRDKAFSLREQAEKATGVNEKMRLLTQAKAFDSAADIKAMELVVTRDPEGTIRSINDNPHLDQAQKDRMISRVEESRMNAEIEAAEKPSERPQTEDRPPSEGKVPLEGEKPSESPSTPSEEVSAAKPEDVAKEKMGTTDRIEKSGYILSSGEMLDMSQGKPVKTMTHEEAAAEAGLAEKGDFGKEGAIRTTPEEQGLEVAVKPTEEQSKTIERFARKFDGKITVDLNDAEGNTMSVRYPEGTAHKKITNDINAFYDSGRVPTGREVVVSGAENIVSPGKTLAESVVEESFSLSVSPSDLKPPKTPKPPKPTAEGETPEGPQKTELEMLSERVAARQVAQKALDPGTRSRLARVFQEHIVDVNEPFKRALMKEGSEAAQHFINRMNLEAGAGARAKVAFEDAQERVFGKGRKVLSKRQQDFMSEITDLIRTVEIDNLRTARQKKGEDIESIKHEGGVTGKEATVLLEKFRSKDPEFLQFAQEKYGIKDYDPAVIEEAIGEYHKVMREQLTELYENGIISEGAYKKLSEEQPYYSPRKYISHWNEIDPKGGMSGIKPLEGGSEGEKVVDMNTLMGDVIARTSRIVARNKKLQAGAAYASEVNSDLVQQAPHSEAFAKRLEKEQEKENPEFIPPGFKEPPRDKEAVTYFENGQRKQLWIDKEMYRYFDYARPDEATEMTMYALSMMTGTPVLKFFATGANPEFAIKNLLLDAMHVWMTTPEYSTAMPVGMAQLLSDYSKVAKDAWNKTGEYKDFIKEGGGMSFLTTQGTETPYKFKRYTKQSSSVGQVRDAMSKIGEFSEAWTRLALRRRYIDNRVKQAGRELTPQEMKALQEEATAHARNYLDFSQGGKTAKMLDKFIPYLNAGVQVTRGSLRAAGKNPKIFAAKLAQITSLATLLTAWNMGDFGDDELAEERRNAYRDDISPEIKARNFIIMTNMAYEDKGGNIRRLYFKIPKDALQSSLTSLAEDIYIKAAHGGQYKLMDDQMMTAMQNELRNITDLGNLPPVIRAMQGYKNNYDSFYETEIWSGREQPEGDASQEYYDGTTPPRFVKFGYLTGMSPVRSQYFAKQFFTEGNLYGWLIGEFLDAAALGSLEGEAKDVMQKEGYEKLKNVPALRRVLKATYPKPSEEVEEAQLDINRIKTENDHAFNQVFGNKTIEEVDDAAVNELMEDIYNKDGRYEAERMIDKVNTRMKEDGVGSSVAKLKWFSPEVRALGFYKLLEASPDMADELWSQAEAAGIASERFRIEVGRLVDMRETSPPGK